MTHSKLKNNLTAGAQLATLSLATQYAMFPEFCKKWETEVLMRTECDVKLGSQVPYDAGCLLYYVRDAL